MKIKAKKGKLLIISDLNITIMDEVVTNITEDEFNNSKDIKTFKNDIEIVEEKADQPVTPAKATTTIDAKPIVTNGGTVVTAGQTIDKTPENVFVANPAPTAEEPAQAPVKQETPAAAETTTVKEESTAKADTTAEVKPAADIKADTETKTAASTDAKVDVVSKADEQKVTASEAPDVPAVSKSGKRGRPSKK